MKYGYWLPVFGGWLRNVDDENMQPTWDYVKKLAVRSEQIGFDLALIAELYLNDIKGEEVDSLDAWSTAAALAAVALVAAGCAKPTNPCTRIAAATTQAAANVGFQMRCHQRGSKTLSDTNAMRRGTSSSRSVESASSVRRVAANSSRQESHVAAWASASMRTFLSSSPSA